MSYKEPKDYDELITRLRALGDPDKQVQALMQYFMESVEYDYESRNDAKILSNLFGPQDGKSEEWLKKISAMENLAQMELTNELSNRFHGPEHREAVVNYVQNLLELPDSVADKIRKNYGAERIVDGEKRINTMFDATKLVEDGPPAKYENGLIAKGVCKHFVDFAEQVSSELGTTLVKVHGNTGAAYGHVWNQKGTLHYDVTYAMFVRDGQDYNGKTEHTKPEDWLGCTDEQLFKLQSIRKITKIGDQTVNIDATTVAQIGDS